MVAWLEELVKMTSLLPAVHKYSVVLNPSDTQILRIQATRIEITKRALRVFKVVTYYAYYVRTNHDENKQRKTLPFIAGMKRIQTQSTPHSPSLLPKQIGYC